MAMQVLELAGNRQERLLMRQRGAGTRQIKDIGFELLLPGQPVIPESPLKPQKSGRAGRTARANLQPRRSARKASQPTQLQSQRSSKRSTTARKKKDDNTSALYKGIITDASGGPGSLSTQDDEEGNPTKKRKTSPKSAEEARSSTEPGPVLGAKPLIIQEEQHNLLHPSNTTPRTVPLRINGKKRKKRKSIGQNFRKKPRLGDVKRAHDNFFRDLEEIPDSADHDSGPLAEPQSGRIQETPQVLVETSAIEPQRLPQGPAREPGAEAENHTSTAILSKSPAENKPRRKKRKSIGQQRPRSKTAGLAAPEGASSFTFSNNNGIGPVDPDDHSIDTKTRGRGRPKKALQNVVISSVNNGSYLLKEQPSQGRGVPRKLLPNATPRTLEVDTEHDTMHVPRREERVALKKRGRPKLSHPSDMPIASITTNARENRKRKAEAASTTQQKTTTVTRKGPKSSIPITVFRASSRHAISSANGDPASGVDPFIARRNNNVNAVDVLAQVCRELIFKSNDSISTAAKNQTDKAEKVALQRKRKTIQIYGEELDDRLIQLTRTLDTNIALTARVRRANKDEKTLRAELKSLERQRADLAQQKADLEAAHEKSQARTKLASFLDDLEVAVRYAKERDIQRGVLPEYGVGAVEVRIGYAEDLKQLVASGGELLGQAERVGGDQDGSVEAI